MSRNIRIIFIILSVIFIIFLYQICRFYMNVKYISVKDDPETNTVNVLRGDFYVFGENGFYGVKNSKGKIIIEARWNEINQIDSERFIVSSFASRGIRYGIIDTSENIIVPFVYTDITGYNDEFLVGTTEKGKYVLFDNSGQTLISEEWDAFRKNYDSKPLSFYGNYIQVEKEKNIYQIQSSSDGELFMKKLIMTKKINGEERELTVLNRSSSLSLSDSCRIYNEVIDNTLYYINALFSNDTAAIMTLSWGDDYRDLMPDNMNIRGSELKYITDPVPEITDSENGIVSYRCEVSVYYISHDDIRWDGSYTDTENTARFEITYKKNTDGKLGILKARAIKTDVSEAGLPEDIKIRVTENAS